MRVYLDGVFALNFAVNYLLLLATARTAGAVLRRGRFAVGGMAGAALTAAAFLPGAGWLCSPVCRAGTAAVMLLTAFGRERRLVRLSLTFLALSCMLSGGILLLSLLTGKGVAFEHGVLSTGMDLKLALCSAGVCCAALHLLFRRTGRHGPEELLPVTVALGGRQILLTALRDTGNTLTDPATGRPVLVAEGHCLRALLPGELLEGLSDPAGTMERCADPAWRQRLRLLPYRAVGVSCAFLLAVRADRVRAGDREYGGLLVALSPTPVSDGGGYQALFGE